MFILFVLLSYTLRGWIYSIVCIYHNLFIYSSDDGHLGISIFWLLWIVLLFVYKNLPEYLFSALLGIYLGVELLSQIVSLCLTFWGTAKLFSILYSYQRCTCAFFLYRSDLSIPSKTHLECHITYCGGCPMPGWRTGNLICKTDKGVKGQIRWCGDEGPQPRCLAFSRSAQLPQNLWKAWV